MVFTHDTEMSLLAAAALVNTDDTPDEMATQAQLDAFYAEFGYSGSRRHDDAELDEVRALRAPLRALLISDRDEAARIVNRMLAQYQAVPTLVRHDGWDYHLHATGPDASLATRIAVETAMAMIDVVRYDEMGRLAVCADETCDGVVVDLSRNRSRRFCSTACGNRVAVAAYRARKGSIAGEAPTD